MLRASAVESGCRSRDNMRPSFTNSTAGNVNLGEVATVLLPLRGLVRFRCHLGDTENRIHIGRAAAGRTAARTRDDRDTALAFRKKDIESTCSCRYRLCP